MKKENAKRRIFCGILSWIALSALSIGPAAGRELQQELQQEDTSLQQPQQRQQRRETEQAEHNGQSQYQSEGRWGEVRSDYIADEVIAVVGGQHILLSDVERTIGEVEDKRMREGGSLSGQTVREEAFENLLLQKMYAERAREDSLQKDLDPVSDLQVEMLIREEVEQVGSVKALEKKYGKEIFAIKEDMKKEAEEVQLAQSMRRKAMEKTAVNYPEVKAFFDSLPLDSMEMIPEQYVFAQIVRMPPQTEERKFQVRQRLLEYRRRILDGERMGALARMYSKDTESARKGGEWGPDDINKLVYPMIDALETLKPGAVSEIIETEYGFHIAEMIAKRGDIVHFRHILLKPEFTMEETEKELKLLDSISKAAGTDKKQFEEAVMRYSDDAQTNQNGGVVFNSEAGKMMYDPKYASSKFMKDALKPTDYIPLSTLQVGEVSAPFAALDETNGNVIYKIVRLNEVIPAHAASLEGDYEIIANFALQNKQAKELVDWTGKAIREMYIWISPEYRNMKFEHNWTKR